MKVQLKFGEEVELNVGDQVVYEVACGFRYRCLISRIEDGMFTGTNPATGLTTGYYLENSIISKEVKRDGKKK